MVPEHISIVLQTDVSTTIERTVSEGITFLPRLVGSVLVGAGVWSATELGRASLGLLFAFLANGIVLSVVREEVPAEREGRFWWFSAGAGCFTAILLVT